MACDVYLSYTSIKNPDNNPLVDKFRDHLEWELQQKTGNMVLKVFQDKRGIRAGDKWEEILVAELASSRLLLVLLSPTWLGSKWCQKEYELFSSVTNNGVSRPVVPLIWDTVDPKTPDQQRLLADLRTNQDIVWKDLKYQDHESPPVMEAMGKLAEELSLKLPN